LWLLLGWVSADLGRACSDRIWTPLAAMTHPAGGCNAVFRVYKVAE
jgi:hypothetical protein